ncbi:interferon-induced protein 44-like [Colossoma macropomum]|uniref:interferon-induced protein 44-like n=1 Tax=Colossoma macropomum TaxID=42526 RepID=UPI0018649D92|nr:interferon-induced protein 44-like [Colossoma macropomum]
MGSSMPKLEFVTVLADKHVKTGEDIKLSCEANAEELMVTWEKNGQKLDCIQGHMSMKQTGKSFALEIKNAEEGDEGKYTLILRNKWGNVSCSAMVTVELNEWRTVEWNQVQMVNTLNAFKIRDDKVKELRFLLHGPIGAGKSSVISSIRTIFGGRIHVDCPASSEITEFSTSHTLQFEKYQFRNAQDGLLPFAFIDVMGVESREHNGVHSDDIIHILKGHIKQGYVFNPVKPMTKDSPCYLKNPSMNDKIHCLVNVIPADKLSMIKDDFIKKMKTVGEKAIRMGILQVVLMTRVDCACPLTKKDLRNVYKSKKIKEKMRECSVLLGVPVNHVFAVCNYHEETEIKEEKNCLMLHALTKIVQWADDYIARYSNTQTSVEG